jgi:hypothetical protein
MLPMPKSQR